MGARENQALHHADQQTQAAVRRVLVVDDSRVQRKILSASLLRWGYEVIEAGSGHEALAICKSTTIDVILSDWMMPGMTGLELCSAFRALNRESYGYFILLTSKSEKGEIARGLDAGADDFLAKPVSADELRARIVAGERILRMEAELRSKNQLVASTLTELQDVYAALDRDLAEARKVQMTLVSERQRDFGSAHIAILLRSSGHVGGDLVGYFRLNPRRLIFYAIDVSGHGVASAMLAARLAGMLTSSSPSGNFDLVVGGSSTVDAWPPELIATRLNNMMLGSMQVDQYFTCIYAEVDIVSGRVALVQAGHPYPLLLGADGVVLRIGSGGLPIGLVAGATYERVEFLMKPGDRLLLASDGLTECSNVAGAELGEEGLADYLLRNQKLHGTALLDALVWDVQTYAEDSVFGDDISAVIYEFRGGNPD